MITQVLKFSDIKKDPNILLGHDHAFVCKRSNIVAHIVSNERMEKLIKAEERENDLDIRLYTAYDCAISALDLTENEQVKIYLKEIIECYLGDKE